jgi:biopolymer transport protein ExbD
MVRLLKVVIPVPSNVVLVVGALPLINIVPLIDVKVPLLINFAFSRVIELVPVVYTLPPVPIKMED